MKVTTDELVRFVSAKPHLDEPDEIFYSRFFCLHGRREVVVLCSDELRDVLRRLPSDYVQPRLVDIKKYLIEKEIPFVEDFKNTTTV